MAQRVRRNSSTAAIARKSPVVPTKAANTSSLTTSRIAPAAPQAPRAAVQAPPVSPTQPSSGSRNATNTGINRGSRPVLGNRAQFVQGGQSANPQRNEALRPPPEPPRNYDQFNAGPTYGPVDLGPSARGAAGGSKAPSPQDIARAEFQNAIFNGRVDVDPSRIVTQGDLGGLEFLFNDQERAKSEADREEAFNQLVNAKGEIGGGNVADAYEQLQQGGAFTDASKAAILEQIFGQPNQQIQGAVDSELGRGPPQELQAAALENLFRSLQTPDQLSDAIGAEFDNNQRNDFSALQGAIRSGGALAADQARQQSHNQFAARGIDNSSFSPFLAEQQARSVDAEMRNVLGQLQLQQDTLAQEGRFRAIDAGQGQLRLDAERGDAAVGRFQGFEDSENQRRQSALDSLQQFGELDQTRRTNANAQLIDREGTQGQQRLDRNQQIAAFAQEEEARRSALQQLISNLFSQTERGSITTAGLLPPKNPGLRV